MSMRILFLLLMANLAHAQYFPLEVGNQWIYRVDEGLVKDVWIAEILQSERLDGKEYFTYRGIQGETSRIRLTEDNRLVQWNADGTESLWADFNAPEGGSYPTSFDRCTGRGGVKSRTAETELLDRAWNAGFLVTYAATNCADAGVLEDLYLPGLGLAQRTYQSFTGPRRYKMTYARIGNASVIASGEYSFRINLNQSKYVPGATLHLRMTLENWNKEPLKLNFFSGQVFDFTIRDSTGRTVYFWSANKLFPAVTSELLVSGEKNWTVSEILDLKPGEYVVEAWLTTDRKPVFKAQVPITVIAE